MTLLEEWEDAGWLPAQARSISDTRGKFESLFTGNENPPPVENVRDESIPGRDADVPIRIYEPDGEAQHPVLVFAHGGGWVRGSIETHDEMCRHLTREIGCAVIAVDYRRPPEDPFPAPLEDVYATVEWVAEFGSRLDLDANQIAVGGDSAGGNLAAATARLAVEREGPELDHQLLIYPVLDYDADTPSFREFGEQYTPNGETMEWYWDQYLSTPIDGANPYAAPLRASLSGTVPSATVVTAGFDPLRDEGLAYVDELRAAEVDVTHHHYETMIHGFLSFPDRIDRAGEAYEEIARSLRGRFITGQ
jgi:acetyl esterase